MHPVVSEPSPLVEAVGRTTRGRHLSERLEDGALRRCPPLRKSCQHGLAGLKRVVAEDLGWNPQVVATPMGRSGDDDACASCSPDQWTKKAAVERVEPRTAPPPAAEREGREQRNELRNAGRPHRKRDETAGQHEWNDRAACSSDVGRSETETERCGEQMRATGRHEAPHGATRSRS